ncbi:hypothetical protein D6833_09575 [Candidatus Parcubacteria bacterium]|nr:MAG: hypothetical protein D6833_09575 [Candidatus Parcubacteria bacterium]
MHTIEKVPSWVLSVSVHLLFVVHGLLTLDAAYYGFWLSDIGTATKIAVASLICLYFALVLREKIIVDNR